MTYMPFVIGLVKPFEGLLYQNIVEILYAFPLTLPNL